MKLRVLYLMLALSMLFVPSAALAGDLAHPDEPMYEIVVELERGQDPEKYAPYFLTQLDVPVEEIAERVNHTYETAIVGFSAFLTEYELDKAQRLFFGPDSMGVKSITESYEVTIPVITEPNGQMPTSRIEEREQVVPTGIQRIQAGTAAGDPGAVDVAVIDTGVDAKHPDLNVVGGYDCTAAYGEDGNYGYDGYGHGTHVAGTIGALDNGIGVVGVAPGARIHSVKVLDDSGSGSLASVICGIEWVAKHTDVIEVANMSLGGLGFESECNGGDPMHNAICVATEQTVFVVAAGNSSQDALGFSPANYDEVITVSAFADFDGQAGGAGVAPQNRCAAMSVDDELATFSNFGADVDISAPGTCILSTLPDDEPMVGYPDEEGYVPAYGFASGTSMAAPHVAGAVARYLAANPDQRDVVTQQVLTWSEANSEAVKGDHDMIHEPLLFVGTGAPRYEASPNDPPA